jgi:hypothetical protein
VDGAANSLPGIQRGNRGKRVVKKANEPSGSSVSTKQMAYTVRDGCKVTFLFEHLPSVSGYLVGMDGYHWKVITPDLDIYLIHKASACVNLGKLNQESSLKTEENKDEIERLVVPFRQFLRDREIIPPGKVKGEN